MCLGLGAPPPTPAQEQFIEINVPPLEETVSPLLMTMLTSSRGQMILLPQRPKMSFKATASSIYYYNLFGMNIRDLTLKESLTIMHEFWNDLWQA